MSTADDAWQEWREGRNRLRVDRASFMAGAEWALEDAADAVKQARETGVITGHTGHPTHPYIEKWLRARASGVGTKDGDDDE